MLIATTRPETLRVIQPLRSSRHSFKHLQGAKVQFPIVNRAVSIVADDYVDPEFGTGCLKVTQAHDINDYVSKKYGLTPLTSSTRMAV